MADTFRALCAELTDALDSWLQAFHLGGVPPQDGADAKLITRARTALAQPEAAMTESNKQQRPTTKAGITTERLDNIRSINYPDPSPDRRPTNPFTGRPVEPSTANRKPAQPEAEGPSDEDLQLIMPQSTRMDFSAVAQLCASKMYPDSPQFWDKVRMWEAQIHKASCEHARAALARWGRPEPVPVPGEVAELATWLRDHALNCRELGRNDWAERSIHAAVLLEQSSVAPEPVPVSERPWEREGWCDERGMLWAWNSGVMWWDWVVFRFVAHETDDPYTHCLPYWAIPLP